jgi:tetratricopeptide (TPR) repeat protein
VGEEKPMAIMNWFQARRDAKVKALPDGYSDIVDLCDMGVLIATGTGQSITDIAASITSRVTVPLRVRIPHGTYFVSSGNYQNMVTRKEYELDLAPGKTLHISLPASCINASRPVPKDTDGFSGVARVSADLARFLQAAEGEDAMTIQAGVWTITDCYSREAIQSHLRVSRGPGTTNPEAAVSDDQIDRAKTLLDSLGIRHYLFSRPDAQSFYQQGMKHLWKMGLLSPMSLNGYLDSDSDKSLAAVEAFTKAIRLKSDYAEAFHERGLARHNLDGHRKERRGRLGDIEFYVYGALQDFAEAIRLTPDYADAYYHRGVARRSTRWRNPSAWNCPFDIQGAVKDLTEAVRLKPDDGDALHELEKTHKLVRDLDGRAESLVHLPSKLRMRGAARCAKGDVVGAVQDYTEAIRLSWDDDTSFRMRGDVLRAKGDLDGAVRDYTEAIRLLSYVDSQDAARHAKDDVAAAIHDESIDLARSRSYVFYQRADARRAKGDLQGAAQDFAEAARLTDYALGHHHYLKGLEFRGYGDVGMAARYFSEAVRLGYKPANSDSH